MMIAGIDKLGGDKTRTKADTAWEDWRALVLRDMDGPKEFITYTIGDEIVDVEAEYRDCYNRGLTVAQAYIEMY